MEDEKGKDKEVIIDQWWKTFLRVHDKIGQFYDPKFANISSKIFGEHIIIYNFLANSVAFSNNCKLQKIVNVILYII